MVDRERSGRRETTSDRGSSDRGSERGRGDDRGRGRDEERGRERGGRDSERGSSNGGSRGSGSSAGYSYQGRTREAVEKRGAMGANEFDKMIRDGIPNWTPQKGDNDIRIVPPTWAKADHYGYDLWVHYGIGPDRAAYLDLTKMLDQPDPITEECEALARELGSNDDEVKEMKSKRRVGVYLVDRKEEDKGVQFWAMPWTVDRDISVISIDKSNGEVLNIDDPDHGYDISFRKDGDKLTTKYTGVSIARRPSTLGKRAWLDFAIDNPIPDVLKYFTYDEIAKAFGGGGAHRERDDSQRDSDRDRDNDRERGARSETRDSGDRDNERGGRDRGRDNGASERGGRGVRDADTPLLTWEIVNAMTATELDALCADDDRLKDIDPTKAESDEELIEWICEDLKLSKAAERDTGRRRVSAPPPAAEPDTDDRLARMREQRGARR